MFICPQDGRLMMVTSQNFFDNITFSTRRGLWTPNEGINQRYLKNWALAVPKNLGVGVNFRPCSEGYFLSGRP